MRAPMTDHDDNISPLASAAILVGIIAVAWLLKTFMTTPGIAALAIVLFLMWAVLWGLPTVYLHLRAVRAWPFLEDLDEQ
jgi:hypothetical protein